MDYFQIKLSVSRVENKDCTVDGFCSEVSFEGFVDCHTVDVSVVNEPDYLVREKLSVILGVEVRFGRFRRIKLKTFSNSFSQNIHSRISL
jgi:hypothetical protein